MTESLDESMTGMGDPAGRDTVDPDEYVPCPRHGTHCFREIPYLRDRIECAIGLYGAGPKGPGEATDRIMMMIEDHIVHFASSLAVRNGT